MALALALAVSGCVSGPEGDGGPLALPPEPVVLHGDGLVTASGPVVAVGSEPFAFAVAPNVTLLLAEIVWEDPVQDIDLALASPSAGTAGTAQTFDHVADGGSLGMPDSPHAIVVASPEAGEWQASAFANGAAALVEYRLAVTLFFGESEVPDGYTGL